MIQEIQDFVNAQIIQWMEHIDKLLLGNEFAIGAVIASISAGSIYMARSVPSNIYGFLVKHLTTSIEFNNTHESYYKLWKYLNERGLMSQSRYLKVSNGRYGESSETGKEMGYGTQTFWLNWYTPLIISSSKEDGSTSQQVKEFLKIQKFGRSHKLFDNLIADLTDDYSRKNGTDYFTYDDGYREFISRQPKRSIDSIALPLEIKKYLINGIDSFMNKEDWFIEHGVPYQLGILLHGPPGTGKTSLIKAIAAYMDKDIVYVTTPKELANSSQRVRNSIIVAEEIDTFGLSNRDNENSTEKPKDPIKTILDDKQALNAVLNALDGVISNHGRILIMTTNYPQTLDKALIRPGRIDLHVHVDYMINETFEFLLNRFFGKFSLPDGYQLNKEVSPVQIQNDIMCGMTKEQIIQKYGIIKK